MKSNDDRFTLQEYEGELGKHPRWGHKHNRQPQCLHRAINRNNFKSDENLRYSRRDLDEVSGLDTRIDYPAPAEMRDMFRVTLWKRTVFASTSNDFTGRDEAVAFAQGLVRDDPDRRVTIRDRKNNERVEFLRQPTDLGTPRRGS